MEDSFSPPAWQDPEQQLSDDGSMSPALIDRAPKKKRKTGGNEYASKQQQPQADASSVSVSSATRRMEPLKRTSSVIQPQQASNSSEEEETEQDTPETHTRVNQSSLTEMQEEPACSQVDDDGDEPQSRSKEVDKVLERTDRLVRCSADLAKNATASSAILQQAERQQRHEIAALSKRAGTLRVQAEAMNLECQRHLEEAERCRKQAKTLVKWAERHEQLVERMGGGERTGATMQFDPPRRGR